MPRGRRHAVDSGSSEDESSEEGGTGLFETQAEEVSDTDSGSGDSEPSDGETLGSDDTVEDTEEPSVEPSLAQTQPVQEVQPPPRRSGRRRREEDDPPVVVLDDSSDEDMQPRARRRGEQQQPERVAPQQQQPPAIAAEPVELPTQDAGDEGAAASTSTCCICLDVISANGPHGPAALPCGHIFGKDCIQKWLDRGTKKCPTCNQRCRTNQLVLLYNLPQVVTADTKALQDKEAKLAAAEAEKRRMAQELEQLKAQLLRERQASHHQASTSAAAGQPGYTSGAQTGHTSAAQPGYTHGGHQEGHRWRQEGSLPQPDTSARPHHHHQPQSGPLVGGPSSAPHGAIHQPYGGAPYQQVQQGPAPLPASSHHPAYPGSAAQQQHQPTISGMDIRKFFSGGTGVHMPHAAGAGGWGGLQVGGDQHQQQQPAAVNGGADPGPSNAWQGSMHPQPAQQQQQQHGRQWQRSQYAGGSNRPWQQRWQPQQPSQSQQQPNYPPQGWQQQPWASHPQQQQQQQQQNLPQQGRQMSTHQQGAPDAYQQQAHSHQQVLPHNHQHQHPHAQWQSQNQWASSNIGQPAAGAPAGSRGSGGAAPAGALAVTSHTSHNPLGDSAAAPASQTPLGSSNGVWQAQQQGQLQQAPSASGAGNGIVYQGGPQQSMQSGNPQGAHHHHQRSPLRPVQPPEHNAQSLQQEQQGIAEKGAVVKAGTPACTITTAPAPPQAASAAEQASLPMQPHATNAHPAPSASFSAAQANPMAVAVAAAVAGPLAAAALGLFPGPTHASQGQHPAPSLPPGHLLPGQQHTGSAAVQQPPHMAVQHSQLPAQHAGRHSGTYSAGVSSGAPSGVGSWGASGCGGPGSGGALGHASITSAAALGGPAALPPPAINAWPLADTAAPPPTPRPSPNPPQSNSGYTFHLSQSYLLESGQCFDMCLQPSPLLLITDDVGPPESRTQTLRKVSLLCPQATKTVRLPPGLGLIREVAIEPPRWTNIQEGSMGAGTDEGSSTGNAAGGRGGDSSGAGPAGVSPPKGSLRPPRYAALATQSAGLLLLSLQSDAVAATFATGSPVWSCAWDPNNEHQVYVGLASGTVALVDLRLSGPPAVRTLGALPVKMPVHSLAPVAASSSSTSASPGGNSSRGTDASPAQPPLPAGCCVLAANAKGVWGVGLSGGTHVLATKAVQGRGYTCESLVCDPVSGAVAVSWRQPMAVGNTNQPSCTFTSPVAHHHIYLRNRSNTTQGGSGNTDSHYAGAAGQPGASVAHAQFAYSPAACGVRGNSGTSSIAYVPGLSGHTSCNVLTRSAFVPCSSSLQDSSGIPQPSRLFAAADETTKRPVVWDTKTGEIVWVGDAGTPTPHKNHILCVKAAESATVGTVLGVCSPSALELYVVAPTPRSC